MGFLASHREEMKPVVSGRAKCDLAIGSHEPCIPSAALNRRASYNSHELIRPFPVSYQRNKPSHLIHERNETLQELITHVGPHPLIQSYWRNTRSIVFQLRCGVGSGRSFAVSSDHGPCSHF